VLARQFLRRGDFGSVREFEERLGRYLEEYNREKAHRYRWTYTGELLRRDTPHEQTRSQRKQGRAWYSPRPQLHERLLYPPRPDRRTTTQAKHF
jgi:hypothetical protein